MDYVDKYFKEKNKDITFLDIREDSHIFIKDFKIKPGISLPIITKDLIDKIKTRNIDEIQINYIIEGIIYVLGIDKSFIYNKEYKEILKNYDENIVEYILYKAIEYYEEEDYAKSGIYSRALLSLDKENVKALFNYSLVIEKLGISFMEREDEKKADAFMEYTNEILNQILKIDDTFALAYYKLGFHYKFLGNYLKASLIWKEFLQITDNDILAQEIREEIDLIGDDVKLETGITYLNYMDFEKALEAFLQLMPKHKDNWNINYLIGQTYNGLNELDLAIEYMNSALDLNKEEIDIYNSLGGMYINTGDIDIAIDIFSMGIDKFPEDYTLYFNRGLIYIALDEYENALNDINRAHDLNPNDERIKALLDELNSNGSIM